MHQSADKLTLGALLCILLTSLRGMAAQQQCLIDVALVVDESGSIRDTNIDGQPDNWQQQLDFLVNIINGFDVGLDATRVALVTFGNRATLHFDLDDFSDKGLMGDFVANLTDEYKGGNTNTTGGLRVARETLFANDGSGGNRPDVTDVVLLVTDGKPTYEVDGLIPEVNQLKGQGVRIIGIGVTSAVNETLMKEIVSDPKYYYPVDDFELLIAILDEIIEETCRTVQPPTPTAVAPGECGETADLYVIMDGSGSIGQENFNLIKAFTNDLVEDLTIDSGRVRMGLMLFSDDAQPEFNLDRFGSRNDITNYIADLRYPRGRTNTAAALRYVRNQGFTSGLGDRQSVPNIVVILTDGNSNDAEDTVQEAFLVKQAGIHIITVGIGDWTNVMELRLVASHPYERNYIAVNSFDDLNSNLRATLREFICDNVNECNSNPCNNGGTCINGINMYSCRCNTGFAGVNCQRSCRQGSDVVFAIDSSGSVGRDNFLRQLDFVRDVVQGLNMQESRVGALQYANNPDIQFHLDQYDTAMGVLDGLSMSYLAGTTNTASAIETMRNNMFTSNNGDRSNVQNIGVVLTDGRSNDYEETWREARLARQSGIEMVAVGIGSNTRMQELMSIASEPNDLNVLSASSFTDLPSITTSLMDALCNNDNACASPNPCRNEGSCIDLLHGYRCECLNGFSGRNCERRCDNEYDIIFAIDSSGSIRNERFPRVLEFVGSIVDEFEVASDAARFGAIIFSNRDQDEVLFQLNTYSSKQDVKTAISNARFIGGRTDIASALEEMNDRMFTNGNGDRSNVQNYIIMLTDGASNEKTDQTIPMAIRARVGGAKIITIGIGSDVNMLEMRGMTSQPFNRMMLMAQSFNDITNNNNIRSQLIQNIVGATCDEENSCSGDTCRNGGQCFDDLYSFRCQCQNDFSGETCDRRCTNQMDVAFVLDFSGSLDEVVEIVIAFTREVTQGLPFGLSRARVSVVSFSDTAVRHFDLNTYQTKQEVLNALSFSRYGGRTNTQEALQTMSNDVFRSDRGDRNGVDNIAVIVTDGGSNIRSDLTGQRAREARNDGGIELYVAAVYDAPDMGEINDIASDPDNEHVVLIPNAAAVQSAADQLLDRLCS